jgi:hypothetical protein
MTRAKALLYPLQKHRRGRSTRNFGRRAAIGIAQMHERKVQIQQCRQQIGKIGGDVL